MRPRLLLLAFAIAALTLALVATVALGDDKSRVRATLSGYEEVPAVSSLGRADLRATIDDGARIIHYTLTISGTFNGTITQAHIHLGQRTANGGIAAFLCGGGDKPNCPQNGMVTGDIDAADVTGPAGQGIASGEWDELVRAIRAGVTYANVHTASPGQPGGEIRGQINDRNQRDNDD